jgi:zona occludens toxin
MAWIVVGRIGAKMHPVPEGSLAAHAASGALVAGGAAPSPVLTGKSILASFAARVPNRPETAPAYDALRKVVRMPRIQGGYCQGDKCRCYMNDGFRAPVDDRACFEAVHAPRFDPYYVDESLARARDGRSAAERQEAPARSPS